MAYPNMFEEYKKIESSYNHYKLLGIDVLLDRELKPWVLEVNIIT